LQLPSGNKPGPQSPQRSTTDTRVASG